MFDNLTIDRGLTMEGVTDTTPMLEEPQEALTGGGVQYEGGFTEAMSVESKTGTSENEHGGAEKTDNDEGYKVVRRKKTYREKYFEMYGVQPPEGMTEEQIKQRVTRKPQTKRRQKSQDVITTESV